MTNPVPSVLTVRETVPDSVDRALTRVLAKAPADRFPTAARFVDALSQTATTAPMAVRRPGARKSARIVGAGTLLAAILFGGWRFARAHRPQVEPSVSVIAVFPFSSSGDTALARLSRDLALTISANLDGQGGIRTVDPQQVLAKVGDGSGQGASDVTALGRSLGAGSVLRGSIVKAGSDAQLDLKLVSTTGDSEPLARVSLRNAPDSINALTDSITWSVLRQIWRRGEPPSPSYANLSTRSVQSLRAFLDGERLSVAGRYPEAIEAYSAAIQADSSFWLAGWRYNAAQGWMNDAQPDSNLERGYESHLAAFGERDRMLIEAERDAEAQGARHLASIAAIKDRFPTDWLAWFYYADHLFHVGGVLGHTNAETRDALQRTVDLNPRAGADVEASLPGQCEPRFSPERPCSEGYDRTGSLVGRVRGIEAGRLRYRAVLARAPVVRWRTVAAATR